jgi:phosphoenolpyruvate-protein phosphotransferase (PTS system enzyme I)
MSEVRLKGRPASPGFAAGPIFVVKEHSGTPTSGRGSAQDRIDLEYAMGAAATGLRRLAQQAGGEAGRILGFQLALLEDKSLSEPAFEAIRTGIPSDIAWKEAIQIEINHYESASDEHFRARASDLKDLRDRVLDHLAGAGDGFKSPPGAVLVANDLTPSRFLSVDWSGGGAILLSAGSPMSHVGILARARGIPMIAGIGGDLSFLKGEALVDAVAGEAIINASPSTLVTFESKRLDAVQAEVREQEAALAPAVTRDGVRIHVYLNIASVEELAHLDPETCDGIGLVRTEFLFKDHGHFPDEDAQYRAYCQILLWAGGRPVTIRTLDAGGDKPIPGFTISGESNPFLGTRGIRLSLLNKEIFRTQLRALIRAASRGPLKIMLPMVTIPAELNEARRILDEEIGTFIEQGLAVRRPQLGIMIEVPAAALSPETFDSDFFSIGSNDLTQYATAAGRDIGALADLANPLHPGVLRMVEVVTQHGRKTGAEVSLCGDAGGEPLVLPHLLKAGLRSVSVTPSAVSRVKATIAQLDLGEGSAPLAAISKGECL